MNPDDGGGGVTVVVPTFGMLDKEADGSTLLVTSIKDLNFN